MTGVATAIGVSAAVGVGASIYSANKAAGASKAAANSSIGEQSREYDQARADNAPFRTTGASALDQVAKLYGLDTVDANGNTVKGSGKADFSSFTTAPDYTFNLDAGQDAINRSAAAKGGLLSGAAVKAGQTFASGLASNSFNDYVSHLEGVAGQGQASTNATTAAGTNMANQNSAAITGAGNARASAYLDTGQTIGNTANGLASNYLMYKYLNPSTATTTQPFTSPVGGGYTATFGSR
jgi:hypothetical protein